MISQNFKMISLTLILKIITDFFQFFCLIAISNVNFSKKYTLIFVKKVKFLNFQSDRHRIRDGVAASSVKNRHHVPRGPQSFFEKANVRKIK